MIARGKIGFGCLSIRLLDKGTHRSALATGHELTHADIAEPGSGAVGWIPKVTSQPCAAGVAARATSAAKAIHVADQVIDGSTSKVASAAQCSTRTGPAAPMAGAVLRPAGSSRNGK